VKFLLVLIIIGILILISFFLFFQIHISSNLKSQFNQNIRNYFNYVAKEIGSPPDTTLAKSISNKYSIIIKYQASNYKWSSEVPADKSRPFFKFMSSLFKDNEFIVFNDDGSRFLFSSDFHRAIRPRPEEFLIFIAFLVIILAGGYLLIKRILKPVKLLESGVHQVSTGNFSHRIPVIGSDELASLSGSFNEMTSKIKDMILSRDLLLLDVSHELRTPITRIKLALEFLEEGKNKESISSDIKEIELMITELLESERLKNDKGNLIKSRENLANLIKEISDEFKDIPPGIVLKNFPELLYLNFDYERMKIAVKNIIENSIKYSLPDSNPIIISLEEKVSKAIIKIIDDGIGIPQEDLPFVFEPFYRADKSRSKKIKGFGLGLSICKKIIEAHGGKIEVASNPDKGITVTLTLTKE
jgi:signal transduction histidine kinase